ncbi:MAG TPA: hypothetical protein DGT23_10615 [Micromonosporaceae bacterium]|nr:hypothetical protein [Micromonosporaceae bacterium]
MSDTELETVRPALTLQQRSALGAVWTFLFVHGRWPTFGELDRELYRTLDTEVGEVLPQAPPGMLHGVPHGYTGQHIEDSREIGLTVAAIIELGVGAAELQMFIKLIHVAVDLERSFEPVLPHDRPVLTAQLAATELGLDPDDPDGMLSRLASILFVEQWGWNSAGEHRGTSWSFQIGPEVRKFRGIQTISDYWDLRPKFWQDNAQVPPQPQPARFAQPVAAAAESPANQIPLADLAQIFIAIAVAVGSFAFGWTGVRTGSCLAGGLAALGLVHARRRGFGWSSARVLAFLAMITSASALFVIALFKS